MPDDSEQIALVVEQISLVLAHLKIIDARLALIDQRLLALNRLEDTLADVARHLGLEPPPPH